MGVGSDEAELSSQLLSASDTTPSGAELELEEAIDQLHSPRAPPCDVDGNMEGPLRDSDSDEEAQLRLAEGAARGSVAGPEPGSPPGGLDQAGEAEELQGLLGKEASRRRVLDSGCDWQAAREGCQAPFTRSQRAAALRRTGASVAGAVLFGCTFVASTRSTEGTWNYFTCYILELSLSADNVFAFYVIFRYFQTPKASIPRCLFWGWISALALRGLLFFAIGQSIQRSRWLLVLFVPVLLYQGCRAMSDSPVPTSEQDTDNNRIVALAKRCIPVTSSYHGDRFLAESPPGAGRRAGFTPLALTLAAIELTDVVFAVDSVPAQFGVTGDTTIIFWAVGFALLCLRSLFVVLTQLVDEMPSLQFYVGAILVLVGLRLALEVFDLTIPPLVSLCALLGIIFGGIAQTFVGGQLLDEEANDGCSVEGGSDGDAL